MLVDGARLRINSSSNKVFLHPPDKYATISGQVNLQIHFIILCSDCEIDDMPTIGQLFPIKNATAFRIAF